MTKEQTPSESKWFQITNIKLSCPYCGIELIRDKQSQVTAFIVFISSIIVGFIAESTQDDNLKTYLIILAGCLFWGSFIIFAFLVKYIEKKEI